MVVRQLPSHLLTLAARGGFATASAVWGKSDAEFAADLAKYMFSFAIRRLGAAGEQLLLAGLLLRSLAGCSDDWPRRAECERDLADMFKVTDCDDCDLDLDLVDMSAVSVGGSPGAPQEFSEIKYFG